MTDAFHDVHVLEFGIGLGLGFGSSLILSYRLTAAAFRAFGRKISDKGRSSFQLK